VLLRPRRVDVKSNVENYVMKTFIGMQSSPNIFTITVVKSTECVAGATGLHGKVRIAGKRI
jgi:hypothetical protein